jgi:hypothetical protein
MKALAISNLRQAEALIRQAERCISTAMWAADPALRCDLLDSDPFLRFGGNATADAIKATADRHASRLADEIQAERDDAHADSQRDAA